MGFGNGIIWGAGTNFQGNGPEIITIDLTGKIAFIGSGDRNISDLAFFIPGKVVGGEIIPIESTSLILAGVQSFSWMIPVVLSGIGIGLFAVSRKSENS